MPEDEITHDPALYPGANEIKGALIKAEEAPTVELAKQALLDVQREVDRYGELARNAWQKKLIDEYHVAMSLNQVLANAALIKLLQSDDDEIVLKAAKELRTLVRGSAGLPGNTTFQAEQMVVQQVEDPAVSRMKELLP